MRFFILFSFLVIACTHNTLAQSVTPVRDVGAKKFVTIGTGGVTGVYYPAGGAICRLVKRGALEHNIRCAVEPTDGSVYNIVAIRNGDLDLGIAQSDWQYHALKGDTEAFKDAGPFKELRVLFSLHSEPFTVIARKNAGIKHFADLKGKRVNIGGVGSGSRATMEVLMKKMGWTNADFKQVTELKASEQGQALCDNRIDAFVHATGHPNGLIQEVTMSCETTLVSVEGKIVEELIAEFPFYSVATIPGGMYTGNPADVKSFGVRATFVSSARVENDVVYNIVKSVFDNFDNFKTLHPVFSALDKNAMVTQGNTARLHDGARKYYAEAGLLAADAEDPGEHRSNMPQEKEKAVEPKAPEPAKTTGKQGKEKPRGQ
jgi:TRAP transporter TAXI family solute receptor